MHEEAERLKKINLARDGYDTTYPTTTRMPWSSDSYNDWGDDSDESDDKDDYTTSHADTTTPGYTTYTPTTYGKYESSSGYVTTTYSTPSGYDTTTYSTYESHSGYDTTTYGKYDHPTTTYSYDGWSCMQNNYDSKWRLACCI